MAENLNYDVSGSKCYNNQESNCALYGRLYDWATAMALPPSCNSSTCASQITAKYKGICPAGWHIPSDDEWTTLIDFVGTKAGTKLRATSGWRGTIYDGQDTYGFAALPGGLGNSNGYFNDVLETSLWWSSSEYNASNAYFLYISYGSESVYRNNNSKNGLFISVRCVKD
jgi:uncharacterized protein (TIGR02145 family)